MGQRVQQVRQGRGQGGGRGGIGGTAAIPAEPRAEVGSSVDVRAPGSSTLSGRAFRPPFFLSMQIRILFFASYRDLLGTRETHLSLPGGHHCFRIWLPTQESGRRVRALPPYPVVAVNEEYATEDRLLVDGDVVAFIPPVAGG